MAKGIKIASGIKVTNSADLEIGEILLGYLGGPNVITRVLIKERGRQESQCQSKVAWDWPSLALEDRGKRPRATRQPLKARKGKKMDSSLKPLKEHSYDNTLVLAQ